MAETIIKQQICSWCSMYQTFISGPRDWIVLCSFCGKAGIRHGGFVRRATVKDLDGLTTEEIDQLATDGQEIRQAHVAIEPHFVIREVANRWKMSPATIARFFEKESGVVRFGKAKRSLRIPLSVLERVHSKLTHDE
jgi:hypothetical protein